MMLKRFIPAFIALGLVGLLAYQLISQARVECRVCVEFKGARQCATAAAPEEAEATEEAHRSACSQMTSGVSEAFACPRVRPAEVDCKRR